MEDRLFVEWFDEARPGWGGYVSTLDREFLEVFARMVQECGPPTRVEFRGDGEGWVGKDDDTLE